MHIEEDTFDINKIYNYLTERDENNELFQQLNLAEGIYIPLIEYIKIIGKRDLPS